MNAEETKIVLAQLKDHGRVRRWFGLARECFQRIWMPVFHRHDGKKRITLNELLDNTLVSSHVFLNLGERDADQVNGFASRIFSINAFNCLTPCSDWSRMTFSSSFTLAKLSALYSSFRVKTVVPLPGLNV